MTTTCDGPVVLETVAFDGVELGTVEPGTVEPGTDEPELEPGDELAGGVPVPAATPIVVSVPSPDAGGAGEVLAATPIVGSLTSDGVLSASDRHEPSSTVTASADAANVRPLVVTV